MDLKNMQKMTLFTEVPDFDILEAGSETEFKVKNGTNNKTKEFI